LTQAEERERHRLARLLHDELQQLLVAAKMRLSLIHRRHSGQQLQQVVEQADDMLTQAIGQSRAMAVDLSPPILYDSGLVAGLRWLARQMEDRHSLQVKVDVEPAAEPDDETTRVFLFQAVRELLLNVVKHAEVGTASVELCAADDDRLRAVVSDHGRGFNPQRAAPDGTSGGFGLFSIRERLELLGGRMTIDAAGGAGTRVTVEMPRSRTLASSQRLTDENNARGEQSSGQTPAKPRQKVRVMLADDHTIFRQGLAGLLREQSGIEIVGEAGDGRQAVEVAVQTRPDVVLMDVSMPVLNGIEATRRTVQLMPEVRVIGLSMHEEADMAAAMNRAGAVAYLRKDTPCETLIAEIFAHAGPVS
jgi:CheY-like chemotaxis protein/two-component sensor histidine kinase